jgi:hypothetical protein
VIFWWYYINREMADYGRARGTKELGDDPGNYRFSHKAEATGRR